MGFGSGEIKAARDIKSNINRQLNNVIKKHDLFAPNSSFEDIPDKLGEVITALHKKYGQQVVVLVDKYDRLIIEVLHQSEQVIENRD